MQASFTSASSAAFSSAMRTLFTRLGCPEPMPSSRMPLATVMALLCSTTKQCVTKSPALLWGMPVLGVVDCTLDAEAHRVCAYNTCRLHLDVLDGCPCKLEVCQLLLSRLRLGHHREVDVGWLQAVSLLVQPPRCSSRSAMSAQVLLTQDPQTAGGPFQGLDHLLAETRTGSKQASACRCTVADLRLSLQ
jgi:hypothetical protein